jgi:RimJ/RimL family protein N-acetyltransferase
MEDCLFTPRTQLRPFVLTDAPAAFSWLSDSEVMSFIPSGADRDLSAVESRLARYISHQQQHGFSKWLVMDRASGEPIGDAGLYYFPDGVRIELGFRLRRDRWGQGFATEIARGWIGHFQHQHPGRPLHAITDPDHVRSQHILGKVGFRPVQKEMLYDHVFQVFELPTTISL